ncbi:putative phosphatidylinositol 4-phosphate 5-kinase MSS4 [Diplonema papillatum]|nr:putative phosphatidylinositol 4-phosphate 5-kinase MSS4 [Diplonema papillatum]
MACCFSLFYDTSAMNWGESSIAEAILTASEDAMKTNSVSLDHPLQNRDFSEAKMLDDAVTPATGGQLHIVSYAPRAFRHFREDPKFNNHITHADWTQEWTATKDKPRSAELGSGKSGAAFIKSINGHYMIKTIDKREVQVQCESLNDYLNHFELSPNSLLMRHLMLLGVEEVAESGKVKMTKYILVFENITDVPANMKLSMEIYDLKGRVPKPGKLPHVNKKASGTLKDKDLMRDFRVPPAAHKMIVQQLEKDTEYLKKHNLMDYSLLLIIVKPELTLEKRKQVAQAYDPAAGLSPATIRSITGTHTPLRPKSQYYHNGVLSHDCHEIFFMGIIDTLTNYHSLKKLANFFKQFAFFEQQLSTIPADEYGNRFQSFCTSIFRHKPRVSNIVGAPSSFQ